MAPAQDPRVVHALFGFWTALGTATMTLVSFAIAIFTPPVSGTFCQDGCVTYPYLEIGARFPRDYVWMFPAIVATLLFVALLVGLHARASAANKLVAMCAVVLGAMAAVLLAGDYFVQLAVVQPSVLAGESDGVSMLTQYNPHGLFIALEELGYLLMSASLACAGSTLPRATKLERAVRRVFAAGFAVNTVALVWFVLRLGHARGYLLEVVVVSVDWLTLIIGASTLALMFRQDLLVLRGTTDTTEQPRPR